MTGDPTAAARQRRHRRRLRDGLERFGGEVPQAVVDGLITEGLLTTEEALNPLRLGQAIADLAAKVLGTKVKKNVTA